MGVSSSFVPSANRRTVGEMTTRAHADKASGHAPARPDAALLPAEGRFIAECFWPGVTEDDQRALDARTDACVAALRDRGERISYLGSILVPVDEVVMCWFEGTIEAVQQAVESAEIPLERLVASVHRGFDDHPPRVDQGGTRS